MKLLNKEWHKIEPYLLGKRGDQGARGKNNRLFIDALLLIASTHIKWSTIPTQYGNWNAIYMRFRRWTECGIWQRLGEAMIDDPDLFEKIRMIEILGRTYYINMEDRLRRKRERNAHKKRLTNITKEHIEVYAFPSEMEDSRLHWVSLMISDR
jgi:transposase